MTAIDYILLAVLLGSALTGIWRGLVREVISLLTWVLAFWFAWRLGPLAEPWLDGYLADPPYRQWGGRALVFGIIVLIGTVISFVMSWIVRRSALETFDRVLGFAFGLLRGIVLAGVVVVVCQAVRLDDAAWWQHSVLLPYVEQVAGALRVVAGSSWAPETV
jgi:membrane protein required for colicin V production